MVLGAGRSDAARYLRSRAAQPAPPRWRAPRAAATSGLDEPSLPVRLRAVAHALLEPHERRAPRPAGRHSGLRDRGGDLGAAAPEVRRHAADGGKSWRTSHRGDPGRTALGGKASGPAGKASDSRGDPVSRPDA